MTAVYFANVDKLLFLRSSLLATLALNAGVKFDTNVIDMEIVLHGNTSIFDYNNICHVDTSCINATAEIPGLCINDYKILVFYVQSTLNSIHSAIINDHAFNIVDYWFNGDVSLYLDYYCIHGTPSILSILLANNKLLQYTLFDKNIIEWTAIIQQHEPVNHRLQLYLAANYCLITEANDTGYVNKTGKKEGLWTYINNETQTKVTTNYVNGVKEGVSCTYKNNCLQHKTTFTNNRESGDYYEYYKFGAVKLHAKFSDGKMYGMCIRYTEEGAIKEKTNYIQGMKHGKSVTYDWDSVNKKCVVRMSGTYINNVKCGKWKIYDSTGKLYLYGDYSWDQRVDRWITYNTDGIPIRALFYDHAKLVKTEDIRKVGDKYIVRY